MNMLLLFGVFAACRVVVGAEVAQIQIFDLIEQNKTGPNDPALVLTEATPSSDIFWVSRC